MTGGYEPDDPKHERYAELTFDRADDERKKARERASGNARVEAMVARPGKQRCGHRHETLDAYVCVAPPHTSAGHFYRREQ